MISATSLDARQRTIRAREGRFNDSLDGNARLPNLFRGAPRTKQTDARAVETAREVEQVRLVVDGEQGLRLISTGKCGRVLVVPTDRCGHGGQRESRRI